MTHAEFLAQTIAEIAEEVPGFELLDENTQQSVRELANEYFHDEYIPRLEGQVNLPRYQAAFDEKTPEDRAYIQEQADFLRSNIIRAQRAAYSHLLEKLQKSAPTSTGART
jgi:hypothetical protein